MKSQLLWNVSLQCISSLAYVVPSSHSTQVYRAATNPLHFDRLNRGGESAADTELIGLLGGCNSLGLGPLIREWPNTKHERPVLQRRAAAENGQGAPWESARRGSGLLDYVNS